MTTDPTTEPVTRTGDSQLLKPACPRARDPKQEKPRGWKESPLPATREKPVQQQRSSTSKNKLKLKTTAKISSNQISMPF